MKDIGAHFERWLRRCRAPPDESAPHRRRYVVINIPSRMRLGSFRWVSYWQPGGTEVMPVHVDFWMLRTASANAADFHEVCGQLELVRCVYDLVLERIELAAKAPRRCLVLRANLVSPSVKAEPALLLASETGSRVRLWTFRGRGGNFDVLPHCAAPGRAAKTKAEMLERMFLILSGGAGPLPGYPKAN